MSIGEISLSIRAIAVLNCLIIVLSEGCAPRTDLDRRQILTPSPESGSVGSLPVIPASYATYTDDTGLVSISFPPDWQANPPALQAYPLLPMTDVIESLESGIPLASTGSLLYLNAPEGAAWCTVQVGPLLEEHRTVQEIADEQVLDIRMYASRFDLIRTESVLVNGRESVIQEFELNLGGVNTHSLVLFMNLINTTWITTCAIDTTVSKYADYAPTFRSILGSIRIME